MNDFTLKCVFVWMVMTESAKDTCLSCNTTYVVCRMSDTVHI